MTCGEMREILFAFLDNELDAALSIDVQRHMEHCPECASEVEIERTIQKRLAAAMERGASDGPTLEESLIAVVTTPARRLMPRRLNISAWISITAGIAAVVILGLFLQRYFDVRRASPQPSGLVDLLVADFDHFLTEGRQVQIASADPVEVSRWLHGKTGLEVTLPQTQGSHCKLIGARKCKQGGKVACALYEMDGKPTSLVLLAGKTHSLSDMERVTYAGRDYWVERSNDHSVVACRKNDVIYAAVSRADQDELVHFMSELE